MSRWTSVMRWEDERLRLLAEVRRMGSVGAAEVTRGFQRRRPSGTLVFTDGPYVETKEFLGGLTIVNVPDEETAKCGPARSRKRAAGPRRFAESCRDPKPRYDIATCELRSTQGEPIPGQQCCRGIGPQG